MAKAHVICCNDATEHVFIGDVEDAEDLKEELARQAYDRQIDYWCDYHRLLGLKTDTPYQTYRKRCYWHIHTEPLTLGAGITLNKE